MHSILKIDWGIAPLGFHDFFDDDNDPATHFVNPQTG